ncbi:TetR/AcrR family transcriptional regulator [Pleomorphomonas sp. PLEO]|uniref:TetR/AcrR family transcriptional regulator n=1 Tax=Pleomorphomonas sp. PLEO TaxID=3239306 RepID=UPI00351F0E37
MQKSETPSLSDKQARSRGRPRAFDREAALAVATRLFWTKGFEATSIADLTEAMKIGSPSLYAAFGSKEGLYAEALDYYKANFDAFVWDNFFAAGTAREAIKAFLLDSAAALTGTVADIPCGCMMTLSAVGSEGHAELGDLVRTGRAVTLDRLTARLDRAVAEGEIPASTDVHALARFVQSVQNGMSILARDNVCCAELKSVADVAMLGWDKYTNPGERAPG